ncbi:MAG: peptidase M28 [Niastella sp. SCN 39-18]|nr:M28 family peptidase [Sphingobacteriales bacterium]ODT50765.1 MAG: peptidase M28 [Niastella sp. SCN 39-18]OJW07679.1 MAG: peptidase M28 [Sphingobacteriales bacterium 39-19]
MKAQQNRLYEDVKFLTELRPYRNYNNLESLEKVCSYIDEEFTNSGLLTKKQKWIAEGKEYTNVIGVYNEGMSKRLIVGAHYDVCGDQPGADDNASAVAGLLETGRLLGQHKPFVDYTIELVAYCLEEPPFFGSEQMGSYIHAKSLFQNKADVIGMICYEMIGYFSDKPNSQPFPSPDLAKRYPSTANFIIVVGIEKYNNFNVKVRQLMSENSNIDVQVVSFPEDSSLTGLAGLSDQRNYWKFGYQALMINDTSFVRNPNYHMASDTIDTLDFSKMTEVINGAYNAIIKIILTSPLKTDKR